MMKYGREEYELERVQVERQCMIHEETDKKKKEGEETEYQF